MTDTRNHDTPPHEVAYPGMPIEAPLPFRGFRIVPGCHYWPDFCRCPVPCVLPAPVEGTFAYAGPRPWCDTCEARHAHTEHFSPVSLLVRWWTR